MDRHEKIIRRFQGKLTIVGGSLTKPITSDDAFFNRNWAGACWGHWARPRLMLDRSISCASSGLGYDCCYADRQVLNVACLCKNKKEGGSARALPVAAPMPKSVSF